MSFVLKLAIVLLSCAVFGIHADVSHLGYNRYNSNRVSPLRLQRLEHHPTPYPAAGYHPDREFNLPQKQPQFPLANQQSNQGQPSNGFENFSGSQQRPQLVYGAPIEEQQRFPQQLQSNRPQNSNGFDNLAEPQQPEFNGVQQNEFTAGNNNNIGDFNNLAEPLQRPELVYGASNSQEQQFQNGNGFDNLSEPQRPQYNYNNSARLRQLLVARLQQAQAQSQNQQQFVNQPKNLYATRLQQQQAQIQTQSQTQAESQTRSLTTNKPDRLTDSREEREEETAESVVDIETTTKKDIKKNGAQTTAINAAVPTPTANSVFGYYPAAAFHYVQPFSAAYVTGTNYQTVQPLSAAYTVSSPFLQQQYALAGPAQLQAW